MVPRSVQWTAPLEAGYTVTPSFDTRRGDSPGVGVRRRTMPVDLSDHSSGGPDLLFADDLSGTEFQLRQTAVYDAQEVREAESSDDMPRFGAWLPVRTEGRDAWMVALGELTDELKRYEDPTGTTFEVTRCEKSGTEQTDPYEVNLESVSDTAQTGLDTS